MSSITLPRPAERVAIVSFFLVFLCGGLVGAVAMSYWTHSAHGFQPARDSMSMSVREWKEQLQLTDDQTAKLTSILDDFSHYYDNLLADGNTRVLQLLNDDQKRRYREMIQRHKISSR